MTYATNNDLCLDAQSLPGTVRSPHRRDFLRQSILLSLAPVVAMLSPQASASANRTTTAQTGELIHNRIHFNGASQDTLLGLQHLGEGYRAYNASLHRFHAIDSLSPFNDGGANAYGYVYGDPVNYNDPSGHQAEWAKRVTTFIKANPAESLWMGAATGLGVASGALWAASTQADDSDTANTLNLVAGIFAALTAASAMGAWVSSKNPRASRQNRVSVVPAGQGEGRAGVLRRSASASDVSRPEVSLPPAYDGTQQRGPRDSISVVAFRSGTQAGPLRHGRRQRLERTPPPIYSPQPHGQRQSQGQGQGQTYNYGEWSITSL